MNFNEIDRLSMNELKSQIQKLLPKSAQEKKISTLGLKKGNLKQLRRKRSKKLEMTSFNLLRDLPILQALQKSQKFKRF